MHSHALALILAGALQLQPIDTGPDSVRAAVAKAMRYQQLEREGDFSGRYGLLSSAYKRAVSYSKWKAEESRFEDQAGTPVTSTPKNVRFPRMVIGSDTQISAVRVSVVAAYKKEACAIVFVLVKEQNGLAVNNVDRTCAR